MSLNLLFVGEERSAKAVSMNVTWKDGRLAAKQLFDAIIPLGIDPKSVSFANWFDLAQRPIVIAHKGIRIAMGKKVQQDLAKRGLVHVAMVHPAARGAIRKKSVYAAHVAEVLSGVIR